MAPAKSTLAKKRAPSQSAAEQKAALVGGIDISPPKRSAAPLSSKDSAKVSAKAAAKTAEVKDSLKAQLPKAKKRKPEAGRDEVLSSYLATLSDYPLLTADEEKEFAKDLRDAEVQCWSLVLNEREVVDYLDRHPATTDRKFPAACREGITKLRRRFTKTQSLAGAKGKRKEAIEAEIGAIAAALRDFDDDRALIDESIDVLKSVVVLPEEGPDKRKRALDSDRARRSVVDAVCKERRRALRIRNKFVRSNLRLVVSVARRFHHYRMPLIDLIQEGNLGLIKSVHRFDHRKGFRFSTYAHWWIRQAIERAIMNKGAQVRLPVHIFDARREVAKASREMAQKFGRDPTSEELAAELNLTLDKLSDIQKAVPREPISLDDPLGDDEDRTISEVVSDGSAAPDECVISVDDAGHVRRMLAMLSPMEIDIIQRRFGLDAPGDETLEEIGKSYNLSRERVRQIQVQGLKKMQAYADMRPNS